jgi:hypothetical protein
MLRMFDGGRPTQEHVAARIADPVLSQDDHARGCRASRPWRVGASRVSTASALGNYRRGSKTAAFACLPNRIDAA